MPQKTEIEFAAGNQDPALRRSRLLPIIRPRRRRASASPAHRRLFRVA